MNEEIKLCINCAYHSLECPPDISPWIQTPKHFCTYQLENDYEIDVVTGGKILKNSIACRDVRSVDILCGQGARWFKQKVKKEENEKSD